MPNSRRFFDEFASVRVSRFRASGVIDPAKRHAVISFGDKQKLIGTAHVRFPNGGGYSFFRCPKCDRLAGVLYLLNDMPRCIRCCAAISIAYPPRIGFGRRERERARDNALDRLIEKVETERPLRFKPAPASWVGSRKLVDRSRSLTASMRRRLVELRLCQLATQQASSLAKDGDTLRTYQPTAEMQSSSSTPSQSGEPAQPYSSRRRLDAAQVTILAALNSQTTLQQRLAAAKS